jgi:hypothetical protein
VLTGREDLLVDILNSDLYSRGEAPLRVICNTGNAGKLEKRNLQK